MILTAMSTLRHPIHPDDAVEACGARLVETLGPHDPETGPALIQWIRWAESMAGRVDFPRLSAVIRHLSMSHYIYRFEFKLSETDAWIDWCHRANAIVASPDQTIRDPEGRVLISASSSVSSDMDAQVPRPNDAKDRRLDAETLAQRQGWKLPDGLPPTPGKDEVVMRDAEVIGWRMLAQFILAVRSESCLNEHPIDAETLKRRSPLAFEALSPRERDFIFNENPNPDQLDSYLRCYESLHLLSWTVGLQLQLDPVTDHCNRAATIETFVDRPHRDLLTQTALRPISEILDQADRTLIMLAAARIAVDQNEPLPKLNGESLDGIVLSQRLHAFNWLIDPEGNDWDEVDIAT
ncbi:MAG: DUF4272 domain-containing protein [Planctomycetota bacterium]